MRLVRKPCPQGTAIFPGFLPLSPSSQGNEGKSTDDEEQGRTTKNKTSKMATTATEKRGSFTRGTSRVQAVWLGPRWVHLSREGEKHVQLNTQQMKKTSRESVQDSQGQLASSRKEEERRSTPTVSERDKGVQPPKKKPGKWK